jgi:fructose-bisphosphate aldolase, class II
MLPSAEQYGIGSEGVSAERLYTTPEELPAPDPALGDKHAYDPRAWGAKAEAAMAARVAKACEELGSAGRSVAS